MRPLTIWLAILCLCLPAHPQKGDDAKRRYKELVAKAKQGDQTVDYRLMRESFFDCESCDSDTSDKEKVMFGALREKKFETALESAKRIIAANFGSIHGHFGAYVSETELGNESEAEFHRNVLKGLLASITGTTDGKSREQAWVVTDTHEEYGVLLLKGWQIRKQTVDHNDGHSYDILTVIDSKTQEEMKIYFNIDRHWKRLESIFGGSGKN